MKRDEKDGELRAEKKENLCEKLSRRVLLVGNRKGRAPTTPLLPWRLYHPFSQLHHNTTTPPPPAVVSARKLAASLWEFHQFLHPPQPKMRSGANNTNGRYHQRHHNNLFKDKGIDFSHFLADPCPSSDPDQVFPFLFYISVYALIVSVYSFYLYVHISLKGILSVSW